MGSPASKTSCTFAVEYFLQLSHTASGPIQMFIKYLSSKKCVLSVRHLVTGRTWETAIYIFYPAMYYFRCLSTSSILSITAGFRSIKSKFTERKQHEAVHF